jgi:hypothetical protein
VGPRHGGPRIRFFEPEHPNPEGLVDPTSWYVRGSDVVVLTTRSEGSWCYPQRFESRFQVVPGGLEALAERTGLLLAPKPDGHAAASPQAPPRL